MKTVFYLDSNPYSGEIRTEKIVNTLNKKFKTFVLSPNNSKLKKYDTINNIDVIRMHHSLKFINKFSTLKFPINPLWFLFLLKMINKYRPSVIIVREIYLTITLKLVITYKNVDLKIILDMAECKTCEAELKKRNIWDYIRRNKIYLQLIEKSAIILSDEVWCVVEEQVERLSKWQQKIKIFSNYIDLNTQPYFTIRKKNYKKFTIVFSGKPSNLRGLEDIIEVSKIIKKTGENIQFIIAGGSKDKHTMNKIRNLINSNNLNNIIIMTGYILAQEMYSYMRGADIGIIPHKNCKAVNHTIPNKIFEYMLFGVPLIVSNAKPLKKILDRHFIGYVYESGNINQLYEIIVKLYNKNLTIKDKNAITCIAKNNYNWKYLEKNIINSCIRN